MPLPELVAAQADRALAVFCERRVPAHARSQVRLEHQRRGVAVTLVERRPVWNDPSAEWTALPIARFKYAVDAGTWTLWCSDRNGRWRLYEPAKPRRLLEDLLGEVERDHTGIFWG